MSDPKPLRVVELRAENFKRLKAVSVVPGDRGVVVVSGRNSQGKSSVIDSIWVAIQGAHMLKDIPKPVRDGALRAVITLDIGEYVVERVIEGDKNSLKVSARIGSVTTKVSSPQAVLDSLLSSLGVDPTEFMRLAPKNQLDVFLGIVDADGRLRKIEERRSEVYARRRDVGRDRDKVKGKLDLTPLPVAPTEIIDLAAAVNEYDAAHATNSLREALLRDGTNKRARIIEGKSKIDAMRAQIADIEAQIAKGEKAISTWCDEEQKITNELTAKPLVDVSGIKSKIDEARKQEMILRVIVDYRKIEAEHAAYEKAYASLTADVEACDKQKQEWVKSAKMPVDGVAFDAENSRVTLRGVPLSQCSTSEQLQVSLAIAMAQAPRLRVIRIRDGSCLDSDAMALLAKTAEANGFQLWVERVDESGAVGVVIEDGEVVSVDGAKTIN